MAGFQGEFRQWLQTGLDTDIPEHVRAYSFNLFELAFEDGVKFGVELIGASAFDPDDSDWACEEVWEPAQRQLLIPIEYSGDTWQVCLERMRDMVAKFLESDSAAARKLKSKAGVGMGFVDGDLEIIWRS